MSKRTISLLLIAVAAVAMGFIKWPLFFITFFFTGLLYVVTLLVLFLFVKKLIWKSLSPKMKRMVVSIGFLILCIFVFILAISETRQYYYTYPTEALESLPYLTWVPIKGPAEKTGITMYNQNKSFKGINIYNPYYSTEYPTAYLMDMDGNVLHEWSAKIDERGNWHHVVMCKDGDLLAIVKDRALVKMDWDSNIKWIEKMRFHHDVCITDDNDIYSITRNDDLVYHLGIPVPLLHDYLTVLSSDGKIKKKISFYKILKDEITFYELMKIGYWLISPGYFAERVKRAVKKEYKHLLIGNIPPDTLHINTIEIINKDFSGLFKKGNVLFAARDLDLIGVIDVKEEKLVWRWGRGHLDRPHHPTLLENGNILIFDNGNHRKYSRTIELNPFTKEIVWEYTSSPPELFFTDWGGANQRLPNGNTLITESGKGRVFEVTKDGEVVWEFYSPKIEEKKRETVNRMMRIVDVENYSPLKKLGLQR